MDMASVPTSQLNNTETPNTLPKNNPSTRFSSALNCARNSVVKYIIPTILYPAAVLAAGSITYWVAASSADRFASPDARVASLMLCSTIGAATGAVTGCVTGFCIRGHFDSRDGDSTGAIEPAIAGAFAGIATGLVGGAVMGAVVSRVWI
ncbi:hypothetical protein ABK905_01735 [Acerihabitans sp. KWT182]|uniref:Uncharacterized protein n=1 Tax=Acerihabitans sp. KWT182 TaxID=3157919 RepID=A0AAU7QA91_9GAMM